MRFERRATALWLGLTLLLLCAGCSVLSGVGGWIMGHDLARREAQAEFATASATQLDLPPLGVLVTRLDRTGPAARAGIQRGDTIIAIDGTPVQDPRDLRDRLRDYQVGDTVRLSVVREMGTEDINVRLAPFPNDNHRPYLGIYYTARAEEPADL